MIKEYIQNQEKHERDEERGLFDLEVLTELYFAVFKKLLECFLRDQISKSRRRKWLPFFQHEEPPIITCRSDSRLVGYARVSSTDQELCLQIDALRLHGVKKEHRFCDKISGAKEDRPGLTACNEALRKGDTLVVGRLDRLGRSMRHLVNMIEELKERGIGFRSIYDRAVEVAIVGAIVKQLKTDGCRHG